MEWHGGASDEGAFRRGAAWIEDNNTNSTSSAPGERNEVDAALRHAAAESV
jgi:hypothetical protein